MAEIEFFAIEEEISELVGWLLKRGCEFIPDLNYETPSFELINDLETIRQLSKSEAVFYVVRQDLMESPIALREVNLSKHFFRIDPRTGGPILLLYWGRQSEKDGRMQLSSTELSYYPWYQNSISGARERPSKALRSLYAEFGWVLRQPRRKIKPGKREYWISPNIETLVQAGAVLVGLEHFTVDQILGMPSKKLLQKKSNLVS